MQNVKILKQAEAEVVPSSSLVEVEVKVGDEVEVGFGVEVGVEVRVEAEVGVDVEVEVDATLCFRHSLDDVQIFFWFSGGWVDGWVAGEIGIKAYLNSSCS